jgi:hypothetical protein
MWIWQSGESKWNFPIGSKDSNKIHTWLWYHLAGQGVPICWHKLNSISISLSYRIEVVMVSANRSKKFLIWMLVALILSLALTSSSVALAQTPVAYEEVGIIETDDLDLLNPTGLAFSPADNTFFVLPAQPVPPQPQGTTTILAITPFADLSDTVSIPAAQVDPLNMAFDSQANRLLLFDAASNDLAEIGSGQMTLYTFGKKTPIRGLTIM